VRWLRDCALLTASFDVAVLDLAELALPLFDETHSPRLRLYTEAHTKKWSAMVDALDAFIVVTPEYNHGYPASVKNAIDYLHDEWASKPIGFVAYGGSSGGSFCVRQLREVVTALGMQPMETAVLITGFSLRIDDDAVLRVDNEHSQACERMITELARTAHLARPRGLVTTTAVESELG
jgi:NAD(P)H-dependent FMN reductase